MATDLDRIDELHQTDMRASKAGDYATLRTLMSDDAVVLPPGGRILRGRHALAASFAAMATHVPTVEVLEYEFGWHQVQMCGDYAETQVTPAAPRRMRVHRRATSKPADVENSRSAPTLFCKRQSRRPTERRGR